MQMRESYNEFSNPELMRLNNEKLIKIQERKARLAKIQAIQQQESAATSSAWYLNVWTYCVTPLTFIMQGLKSVLTFLSPVAVGLSWLHTLHAVKTLYENKNRTFADYGRLFFSLTASVVSTAALALGTAVMAPALPFIALGVFSAFALYGIFNFAKNIYRAIKTNDNEERTAYLQQAGKQLIGIVINSLAIAATVIFGIKMADAVEKLNTAIEKAKEYFAQWDFANALAWGKVATDIGQTCLDYLETGTKVLIALTSFVAAGIVAETVKMNKESLEYLRHPTKIWYELKSNPLSALKMLVMAPVRLAALVVAGPVQALIYGVAKMAKGMASLFKNKVTTVETTIEKPMTSTKALKLKLDANQKTKAQIVAQKIKTKMTALDHNYPEIEYAPEKIQAKRFQLAQLHQLVEEQLDGHLGDKKSRYLSVNAIEQDAKKISVNVYSSFFRKSEVQQIAEEVRELLQVSAAPAA